MSRNAGFTLLELIVVISLMLILMSMSLPALSAFRGVSAQKESVRNVFAALRQARSHAISENLEYQVAFDLDQQLFWLERGNRPDKSTSWERVREYGSPTGGIQLSAPGTCTATTGQRRIQFNPNGTSNTLYICAIDPSSSVRYRAGIPIARTGRPVIHRDASGNGSWK